MTMPDEHAHHVTPAGEHQPAPPASPASPIARAPLSRAQAIGEAVLCSSYPTQILAATILGALGSRAVTASGGLNPTYVVAISLLDAAMVVALVVYCLRRRGESVSALCLGNAPLGGEVKLGVALVVPVTVGVALFVAALRVLWPSLQNVPTNPLTALMADPNRVVLFALVVVIAGGVREEIQRAFQLHRLTPVVMSPGAALVAASVSFGLGHTVQGYDVAVATFGLGVLWGGLWLRRQSIVAAAVCHGLFNLGQVIGAWALARSS